MVVNERTARYMEMVHAPARRSSPSRRNAGHRPSSSSSKGYYAQSRQRSRSFSKSPSRSPSVRTTTTDPYVHRAEGGSQEGGVYVQRLLSREDISKVKATMIVDDEIDGSTMQQKFYRMKESEKFRAISRMLAGKRPEHTLDSISSFHAEEDSASIPPPPISGLYDHHTLLLRGGDTGLHSPDFAVDRNPSNMSAARRRHRSPSPYGDVDTFSDVDDGRLDVEVIETDQEPGYKIIPNENYLRLHRHSQRAMMYSKMARSRSRERRASTPELRSNHNNNSSRRGSKASTSTMEMSFGSAGGIPEAERRQKLATSEAQVKGLEQDNHKLKLERKRLRGVIARQQDQISALERDCSARVENYDVDKKLEANLLHILRCVRTTIRPFRREILPDLVESMTQQQKIVYYFLRSGTGSATETVSEKPIPKREMSLMESTDLSEGLSKLDLSEIYPTSKGRRNPPINRPVSASRPRRGPTPPPGQRGTSPNMSGMPSSIAGRTHFK